MEFARDVFSAESFPFMTHHKPARLPPLPALRAFDAVARAQSVRDAAEVLGLTPSAVSHQLKKLEEHVGTPLLKRGNRRIELTAAGVRLSAYVKALPRLPAIRNTACCE
jgi:DNA-binding transcriptional ArsR family regulator